MFGCDRFCHVVCMKPNILFVFSDQHRWCDLGCSGNADVVSPNLDRFAEKGLRFMQCISNAPVCVPARGSMLTGLYPLNHGAVTNDLPIRSDVESVADVLRRNGYHTGYFGKWHLGGVPRDQAITAGRRLGFQEWKVNNCDHAYMDSHYHDEQNVRHEIEGYDAEEYTSQAIGFIERNRERPWGLWLSWGPPHDPYFDVPRKYLDLYEDRTLTPRANLADRIVNRLDRPEWTRGEAMEMLKGYYAQISALDEQFGRLCRALEKSGQLENTIVVYTSDHGDQLGSQGWSNKQFPYEESIRVPLLVGGPGIRSGVCDELIGLVDLPGSLLAQAGMATANADGTDLSALFRDADAAGLEACYIFDLVPCHQSMDRGTDAWRGVRTQTHTYACHADGSAWLLFDHADDPFQKQNRVDDGALEALRGQLHRQTEGFARQHDALLPWPALLSEFNLVESWNESQRYFGMKEL